MLFCHAISALLLDASKDSVLPLVSTSEIDLFLTNVPGRNINAAARLILV